MKKISQSLTFRLIRHLSTTAAVTNSSTTTTNTKSSSITISKAKSTLRKEHDPDKALKIYSSVSNNYTSPVSSRYAQELTVLRLAKAGRFDDIKTLIESHKNDPKITQEPYFCTLIRCFGKVSMFDDAFKLYHEMDHLGTPRTTLSFNALLAAANQSRLFDRVPQLFDEMPKRHGFKPDKVSYGILIRSYCERGNGEMGLSTLREMEQRGIEVTPVSFTTVLDAMYKSGKVAEAEDFWNQFKLQGFEFDVAAWNVRIANAQGGEPEGVKRLIEEMSGMGLKPDTISYNYLLTCYCRSGMIDEAMKLYEELEDSGFRPKAATFRTLVHYLCRGKDYDRAYAVFERSVFHNKIPDFATLKNLVEGLVEKKMKKEAKGLIRTVKKKFPPRNAWNKVEVEFGLASDESSTENDVPEAQKAAR